MKRIHAGIALALGLWAGPAGGQFLAPGAGSDWSELQEMARFHVEETEYLLQVGDLNAASTEIQQALSMVPDNPTLLMWAAELYLRRRQLAMSESYWARLAEMYPTNAVVMARWGSVLYRMERPEEAKKTLERAMALSSANLSVRFSLACLHLTRDKVAEAEALLRNLLLPEMATLTAWMRTDHAWLLALLRPEQFAWLYEWILGGGRPGVVKAPEGEPDIPALIERAGQAVEAFQAAQAAVQAADWTNALPALDQLIAHGVSAPHVRLLYNVARFQSGDRAAAIDGLAELVRQAPDTPRAQFTYGMMLLEEKRFAESVKPLQAARRSSPDDAEPLFALMCAHAAQKQVTDVRTLARALNAAQRVRIAEWIKDKQDISRHLETNQELHEWLMALLNEPAPESDQGDGTKRDIEPSGDRPPDDP